MLHNCMNVCLAQVWNIVIVCSLTDALSEPTCVKPVHWATY